MCRCNAVEGVCIILTHFISNLDTFAVNLDAPQAVPFLDSPCDGIVAVFYSIMTGRNIRTAFSAVNIGCNMILLVCCFLYRLWWFRYYHNSYVIVFRQTVGSNFNAIAFGTVFIQFPIDINLAQLISFRNRIR